MYSLFITTSHVDFYCIIEHYSIVGVKKKFLPVSKLNRMANDLLYNDPAKGLEVCREAFILAESRNDTEGVTESTLLEGWCLILLNRYEKAIEALDYSLKSARTNKNTTGEMKALNAFGVLYTNISDYRTAMEYYASSLELSKESGNRERTVTVYINIGTLYSELDKDEEALDYYDKASDILQETGNREQLCACLINIADSLEKQGKYREALIKYSEGLAIARDINNRVYECNCLTSMGRNYQETGDFAKAEENHLRSLELAKSLGNNLGRVECLTNLGYLHLKSGNIGKSAEYHEEALDLGRSIKSKYFISLNYKGLADLYETAGDMEKALKYFKMFHILKIESQNDEIDIKLKNVETKNNIEAAKKEALAQKEKNDKLKEAFDRISTINKVGQEITSSLDPETVMTTIYENISSFISADQFGIALYNQAKEEIDYKYFIEEGKRTSRDIKSVHTSESMAAWSIRNDRYIFSNNIQKEHTDYVPKMIGTNKDQANSVIFVPLKTGKDIIGVMTVQSYKKDAYTEQHLEIIQAMGSYSAIAIANSLAHEEINELNKIIFAEKKELEKAYQKIDNLANHDILTGLPNRRLFSEILKREIDRSIKDNLKISVLFIDLDNFKPINDFLGHDAGDAVLKMVAQRFKSTLRGSDTIARIGGDEFAAVISKIKTKSDIEKIARKIINKFSNPFKVKDSQFEIGVSIGISIFPDDDKSIEGLLQKADNAMYKIKSRDKNSFGFFNSITEPAG